jgi:predicted house-cleaning noncanonical NTP pyrophosphatase (MazG superfamily)
MVEYLKEIAEDNRNNNVVKAAYGDLYNMSLADMRAITSLTEGDISSIYSQNMSYSDMQSSLAGQLNSISKRLSTGEMIQNVFDNFLYTAGSGIAQNISTYITWKITDLIENSTGGIGIPSVLGLGTGVIMNGLTIEGLVKTGIVGLSTLAQIGSIISSINNNGGTNLNAWGYTDMLQRGEVVEQKIGSTVTTSGSTYVGSSSSSDIKKSSIAGATEDSKEVSEITNADSENEYSFDDWYRAILIDNDPIYIKSAEEYSAHDIYKAMYKDKTPVPVTIDQNTGLGAILMNLTAYMTSVNRITDVNIKKADIPVPTTVYKLDNKLKEEIKNYIKTTYLDQLATELREALIGQTRGLGNATIAKVCDKILNDKVDVEVKNNNFERFLDIQSGFVG